MRFTVTAHYYFYSCSRDILLGCRLIDTLKTGQNSGLEAFGKRWELKNWLKTANVPVLKPFLRYKSGCKPIEYRGSSYKIESVYSSDGCYTTAAWAA